jgi:hypothetical protein
LPQDQLVEDSAMRMFAASVKEAMKTVPPPVKSGSVEAKRENGAAKRPEAATIATKKSATPSSSLPKAEMSPSADLAKLQHSLSSAISPQQSGEKVIVENFLPLIFNF